MLHRAVSMTLWYFLCGVVVSMPILQGETAVESQWHTIFMA